MAPSKQTAHVIALSDMPDAPAPDQPHVVTSDASNPLHQVKARLQVCVGEATITVGELMALRERQVLTLNQPVEAAVDVLLEGKVVARGLLVAVDDHFAVQITELPLPLKP